VLSTSARLPDSVSVPTVAHAVWVERLLWVFMLSFALDYRSAEAREGASGAGIDQLLFLGSCMASTLGIVFLGWKFLTVRPGAWLLAFWGLFIAFMLANSVLQGVPTGRFEVQSPATNWITAWIACAILLRGRFHWNLLVACGVLFIGIGITVSRSLIFPVVVGGMAAAACFVMGVSWKQYQWSSLGRRLLPVAAVLTLVAVATGLVALFQPLIIERWNERLFHNASDRNLGADISYLTRKAEADAIWKILSDDPVHFIHGRGIGSSYYWDSAYMPEIWMVIPKEEAGEDDIWFAGHSVWTYGLLSGGVIALASYLVLLGAVGVSSLLAARANASDPGPDQWLAFVPFVATCCLISESLTSNPFQERLVGIIFGVMAGLPQAFMVRSSWIHATARRSL
jgi:hypothetical protein